MAPHRMRLGTRSCAECRRRRVRCIFPDGSSACEACTLHSTPCRAQQAGERSNPKNDDATSLRKRLEELEAMVKQLQGTSSSSSPSIDPTRPVAASSADSAVRDGAAFGHAPLIKMIKDDLVIEEVRSELPVDPSVQSAVHSLRPLLLDPALLQQILVATQQYWAIWPPYYTGSASFLRAGCINEAIACFTDAFNSEPVALARAVLWLSLCIQQLPKDWEDRLPLPAMTLITNYIRLTDSMLQDDVATLEEIECRMLQHKLHIDLGQPTHAWRCARKAMTSALLQGFHRLDASASQRLRHAWYLIWEAENTLGVVLGVPTTLPKSHPSLAFELGPAVPGYEFRHATSRIAGAIVERDQCSPQDYAVTTAIDQDWERCAPLLPQGDSDSQELHVIYYKAVAAAMFHHLRKYLHLPFIQKARTDYRYEASLRSAANASREIVRAHMRLRENRITQNVTCELMDFQSFSAGLILVIILSGRDYDSKDEDDWELIRRLAVTLRSTSGLTGCSLAMQGAQVLEILLSARRSEAGGPKRYEVVIPYFGRVYMTAYHGSGTASSACDSVQSSFSSDITSPNFGKIDITADFFDAELFPDLDSELAMDWATVMEY